MGNRFFPGFCGVVASIFLVSAVQANPALLVGIGDYQHINDLPGIDLDIGMMRDLAPQMGYADLTVLEDEQATYENVVAALKDLLSTAQQNRQPALFYFSGHGAQFKDASGDEDDGKDEGLIMHDTDWNNDEAYSVLLDDELSALLQQLSQGQLLMLVDACNSGTVDKSVYQATGSKYFPAGEALQKGLTYIPVSAKATDVVGREPAPADSRYVAINAAQDHEFAQATHQGSYFTLGLREMVKTAVGENRELTPKGLHQSLQAYLREYVRSEPYSPTLRGNSDLFDQPLQLRPGSMHGALWDKLEEVVRQYGGGLDVRTDQGDRIRIGQFYTLQIDLPVAGFLSVVAVDSGQLDPVVLFPNPWRPEQHFPTGQVVLGGSGEAWGLQALEPPSKTLITAIVTPEPLQMYDKGVRVDRGSGVAQKVFAVLSGGGLYTAERMLKSVPSAVAGNLIVEFY